MIVERKLEMIDGVDTLSVSVHTVGDETDSWRYNDRFKEEGSKVYVIVKQEINFFESKEVKVLLGEKVPIYSQGPSSTRKQGSLFPMVFKVHRPDFFWPHVDHKGNRDDMHIWQRAGDWMMPLEDVDYIDVQKELYSLDEYKWTNVGIPVYDGNHEVAWFRDLKRVTRKKIQ